MATSSGGSPASARRAPGSPGDGDVDGGDGEANASTTAAVEAAASCGGRRRISSIPAKRGHGRRSEWWRWVWGFKAHPVLPFIGAGEEERRRSCARPWRRLCDGCAATWVNRRGGRGERGGKWRRLRARGRGARRAGGGEVEAAVGRRFWRGREWRRGEAACGEERGRKKAGRGPRGSEARWLAGGAGSGEREEWSGRAGLGREAAREREKERWAEGMRPKGNLNI